MCLVGCSNRATKQSVLWYCTALARSVEMCEMLVIAVNTALDVRWFESSARQNCLCIIPMLYTDDSNKPLHSHLVVAGQKPGS